MRRRSQQPAAGSDGTAGTSAYPPRGRPGVAAESDRGCRARDRAAVRFPLRSGSRGSSRRAYPAESVRAPPGPAPGNGTPLPPGRRGVLRAPAPVPDAARPWPPAHAHGREILLRGEPDGSGRVRAGPEPCGQPRLRGRPAAVPRRTGRATQWRHPPRPLLRPLSRPPQKQAGASRETDAAAPESDPPLRRAVPESPASRPNPGRAAPVVFPPDAAPEDRPALPSGRREPPPPRGNFSAPPEAQTRRSSPSSGKGPRRARRRSAPGRVSRRGAVGAALPPPADGAASPRREYHPHCICRPSSTASLLYLALIPRRWRATS